MMRWRPILFKLHQIVGLIAAVFVLVLGATGAIMAFEPELERLSHPHLFYVRPQSHPLTLEQVGTAVRNVYAHDTIEGYLVPTRPDLSYQVGLSKNIVYLDPYTGAILGTRSFSPDWLTIVHQVHTHLLIPGRARIGQKIVTAAAGLLLLLLLSGFYLWWPAKRVTIDWRASPRRRWFDLHNASGIIAWVFLFVLTLTGLTIGLENVTTPLFYRVTGSTPSRRPSLHLTPPAGAHAISLDSAFALARLALPGAAPFEVDVGSPTEALYIRARYPEDRTPGGRSAVVINQYTGHVLFAEGSRAAPAGTRMVTANRAIHTGDLFGIPSKILMSLASVLAMVQVASGVMMWLRRGNMINSFSEPNVA